LYRNFRNYVHYARRWQPGDRASPVGCFCSREHLIKTIPEQQLLMQNRTAEAILPMSGGIDALADELALHLLGPT
jgi:hypothetical protein